MHHMIIQKMCSILHTHFLFSKIENPTEILQSQENKIQCNELWNGFCRWKKIMLKMVFRNPDFNLLFPIQTQGLDRCVEAELNLAFEEDKHLVYSSNKEEVNR